MKDKEYIRYIQNWLEHIEMPKEQSRAVREAVVKASVTYWTEKHKNVSQ